MSRHQLDGTFLRRLKTDLTGFSQWRPVTTPPEKTIFASDKLPAFFRQAHWAVKICFHPYSFPQSHVYNQGLFFWPLFVLALIFPVLFPPCLLLLYCSPYIRAWRLSRLKIFCILVYFLDYAISPYVGPPFRCFLPCSPIKHGCSSLS